MRGRHGPAGRGGVSGRTAPAVPRAGSIPRTLAWITCVVLGGAAIVRAADAPRAADTARSADAGERITFTADDSVRVPGTWYAPPDSGPVLVVAPRGHGPATDLAPLARAWQARGFGVLTFAYRGFRPDGRRPDSLAQVVFASAWVNDMVGALRWARAHAGRDRHVFAWGQDVGSDVAVAAAGRDRRLCDGLAVEGLFRTSQEHLRVAGLSGIPEVIERHRALVQPPDEPLSAASRLQVPLLVVLAQRDSVTPPETTKQIAARNLVRWEELSLPEAGHEGAENAPGYFDKVADWLKQWRAFPAP
jgi:alpha-beta hydrolase superfamily lysophospholipase